MKRFLKGLLIGLLCLGLAGTAFSAPKLRMNPHTGKPDFYGIGLNDNNIDSADNVSITTPADKNLLIYNNSTSKWANGTAASFLGTATTNGIVYCTATGLTADTPALTQYYLPYVSGTTGRLVNSVVTQDASGSLDWTSGNVIYCDVTKDLDALIASAAVQNGDTLILGSGTYTITDDIDVTKAINIVGQGKWTGASGTGTQILCATASKNCIDIAASNVRVANLSISATGSGDFGIQTAHNLSGIIIEDIDVNVSSAGAIYGINLNGTNATIRNTDVTVNSSTSYGVGIALQNSSSTTQNAIVNCYSVNVNSTSAATITYGFYLNNLNDANTITLNCYSCRSIANAGTSADKAVQVESTTTFNAYFVAYDTYLSGNDYDVYNAANSITLSNCTLANNTTSGTISYAGDVAAGKIAIGGNSCLGAASTTTDNVIRAASSTSVATVAQETAGTTNDVFRIGHLSNAIRALLAGYKGNGSTSSFASYSFVLDNFSNLSLSTSTPDSPANGNILIKNGTVQATPIADNSELFATDYNSGAGKSSIHAKDEQGYVVPVGSGEFVAQPYELAGTILGELTAAKLIFSWDSCPNAETDLSNNSNAGTYNGTMTAADRILVGRAWALDFDGTDDYVGVNDSDTLSFGNGSTDSAFSVGGWIQVTDQSAAQIILAKWKASNYEYNVQLLDTEKIDVYLYDQSAGVAPHRVTDAALSVGWHFVVVVYSVATGGATAANDISIYVDGVVVASTATNNGSYVAMKNLAEKVTIGAQNSDSPTLFFKGDMGQVFVTGEALSAASIWKMYVKTRGYYKK